MAVAFANLFSLMNNELEDYYFARPDLAFSRESHLEPSIRNKRKVRVFLSQLNELSLFRVFHCHGSSVLPVERLD
jgi:hypothetical protein